MKGRKNSRRWGKRKKQQRDWKNYERKLVMRGEILIPIGVAEEWQRQIKKMNKNKEGAAFVYPDAMIECLSMWKCLAKFPYRTVEGLGGKIMAAAGIDAKPDHTTLCRRFNALGKKFYNERKKSKNGEPIYAVFDGSGLKVCNRGEWMHYKHKGKRKGFIRICFLIDSKTGEIIDFSATTESVAEQKKIRPMLKRAVKNRNIGKLAVDGIGDDWRNFELLDELGIKPVIKIRANANPALSEDDSRKRSRWKEARKFQKWGYRGWARRRKYGQRWQGETGFSCFKGYFGEYVFSRSMNHIKAEVGMKVHFYNQLRLM